MNHDNLGLRKADTMITFGSTILVGTLWVDDSRGTSGGPPFIPSSLMVVL